MTALSLLCALIGVIVGSGAGLTIAMSWRAQLTAALANARHAATRDPLTGLLNRAGWLEHAPTMMDSAARDGARLVVFLIDLDQFKPVNDRYGHHAGDLVLQAVGHRLVGLADDTRLIARLGGDEFAILATTPGNQRSDEWTVRLGDDIQHRITAPITVDRHALTVGASIGHALLAPGARRAHELSAALNQADMAMYRNKDQHRAVEVATR